MINTMANADVLWGAYDWIVEHPNNWDQTLWSNERGTTMCIAGVIVMLHEPSFPIPPPHQIFNAARRLANLSFGESEYLFFCSCWTRMQRSFVVKPTVDDLRQAIEHLVGLRG